jgi:type II secretory pathway pseudopilin PulG
MFNIKKYKKNFTVIELLIVIGIIALLSALMFPVMSLVRNNAKALKAKSMATAICAATDQFELDYGQMPIAVSTSDTQLDGNNLVKYDTYIAILAQQDYAGHSYKDSEDRNLHMTTYLNVPSDYDKTGYIDPWGHQFVILLDTNYDGKVKLPNGKTVYGRVFVYSYGKNTTDDKGDEHDDVVSWK